MYYGDTKEEIERRGEYLLWGLSELQVVTMCVALNPI